MNCSTFLYNHKINVKKERSEEDMISILERIAEFEPNAHEIKDSGFNFKAISFLESKIQEGSAGASPYIYPRTHDSKDLEIKLYIDSISRIKQFKDTARIPTVQESGVSIMQGRCLSVYGAAFEFGLFGLKPDIQKAFTLYKKSAILKNPLGTYSLARCFEFGIGTEKDVEKACIFYRVSYKLGYIKGLHRYALILIKGNNFVPKDIPTGCHLLELAVSKSDRNYSHPYYDLGMFYKSRDFHILTDHKYAFQIFLKGARIGNRNCQYKVAEEYETGIFVQKDIDQALKWYRAAADNGQSDAQYKLAYILIQSCTRGGEYSCICTSNSVSNNYNTNSHNSCPECIERRRESLKYVAKSAYSGNIRGILLMGEIHESGNIVEPNNLLALWWYRIGYTYEKNLFRSKIIVLEKILGVTPSVENPRNGFLNRLLRRIKNL